MATDLKSFLKESLKIEGIMREPIDAEFRATIDFLALREVDIGDMKALVKVYQPDAVLRDNPTLNVRVGDHVAPRGGDQVVNSLMQLLEDVSGRALSAWEAHVRYETLHPFTDGNGRSGRALWLWLMNGEAPLNFLHHFYYQTLSNIRLSVA